MPFVLKVFRSNFLGKKNLAQHFPKNLELPLPSPRSFLPIKRWQAPHATNYLYFDYVDGTNDILKAIKWCAHHHTLTRYLTITNTFGNVAVFLLITFTHIQFQLQIFSVCHAFTFSILIQSPINFLSLNWPSRLSVCVWTDSIMFCHKNMGFAIYIFSTFLNWNLVFDVVRWFNLLLKA